MFWSSRAFIYLTNASTVFAPCQTQIASSGQIVDYSVFVFHCPIVQMTKLRSPSWPLNPGLSYHMPRCLLPSLRFCLLSLTAGDPHPGGSSVRSGILSAISSHCSAQGPPGLSAGPWGTGRGRHSLLGAHSPVRADGVGVVCAPPRPISALSLSKVLFPPVPVRRTPGRGEMEQKGFPGIGSWA